MYKLPQDIFACIVKYAPLISIDLIVENNKGFFLLGKRKNQPAKGFYFVPGGRILKGETIKQAFKRISNEELGIDLKFKNAIFLGVYEHFYRNSFVSENIPTHYIVLAYKIKINNNLQNLPKEQHSHYKWFSKEEILESKDVHYYTKLYFKEAI